MARYPTANLEHPGRSIDLVVHMWMAEMPVVGVGWGRIPEPTQGEIAIYKEIGERETGPKNNWSWYPNKCSRRGFTPRATG